MLDSLLHGVDGAPGIGLRFRRPHRLNFALEFLQAVADVGGLLRRALWIDENWQIARHAGRVHVIEKIRAMAAKQILHIVLRRRDDDVNAGFFHQPVEAVMVERNCKTTRRLSVDIHGHCSGCWRVNRETMTRVPCPQARALTDSSGWDRSKYSVRPRESEDPARLNGGFPLPASQSESRFGFAAASAREWTGFDDGAILALRLHHPNKLLKLRRIVAQRLARTVIDDAAAIHHYGSRGDIEREARVLLDQNRGEAAGLGQTLHRTGKLFNDHWRETFRRFV